VLPTALHQPTLSVVGFHFDMGGSYERDYTTVEMSEDMLEDAQITDAGLVAMK
jgi:hypothetical protein